MHAIQNISFLSVLFAKYEFVSFSRSTEVLLIETVTESVGTYNLSKNENIV